LTIILLIQDPFVDF